MTGVTDLKWRPGGATGCDTIALLHLVVVK